MSNHSSSSFIGGKGVSRHLCMDIDHDGLCDYCAHRMPDDKHSDAARQQPATATKVWKVECLCGTNWVYDEFADSLPDECENCGRPVEIMPGELGMDSYDWVDLQVWLGIDS